MDLKGAEGMVREFLRSMSLINKPLLKKYSSVLIDGASFYNKKG